MGAHGSEDQPQALSTEDRDARAEKLIAWYYDGGGLLLSAEAFLAFRLACGRLSDASATDEQRWRAFSALRTELKIDVGVRHPDVRAIPMGDT